jgi:hypothetical protein
MCKQAIYVFGLRSCFLKRVFSDVSAGRGITFSAKQSNVFLFECLRRENGGNAVLGKVGNYSSMCTASHVRRILNVTAVRN